MLGGERLSRCGVEERGRVGAGGAWCAKTGAQDALPLRARVAAGPSPRQGCDWRSLFQRIAADGHGCYFIYRHKRWIGSARRV